MAMYQDYMEFLSEFVNGLNVHDQLPVSVSSYTISDDELAGDFVHWLLQYLAQKHCPLGLVAPLVRSVVEEMLAYCRADPDSLRDSSGQFTQLRLMQACTARVNALCMRLHQDPALLAPPFLAPPPPHLTPVAAHGARSSQRRGMEDRHVVVHDFNGVFNVQDDTSASYYAVFDGHAGQEAAVFSAAHVHQFLAESRYYPADPPRALKDAILRTDHLYLKKSRLQSGTTALCTLLRGRVLHVAWVGDSQAALVVNGKAHMIVDPHKPKRPDEERRITELGGLVLFHGMWRVQGQLAVSRAIGDPNFKPYVSADAEVRTVHLQGDEELLIMASDGLFDFVTPQQATSAVFQQLQDNPDNINAVCSRLINLAKNQGSTDDISVIVAFLTDPRELSKRPVPPAMDLEDLVDTSASPPPHLNGTNNQWSVYNEPAAKKGGGMDPFGDPAAVPTKQNGSGFLYDMGPETDVDRIDESDEDEEDDAGSQDGARPTANPFAQHVNAAEEEEEAELRRLHQQQAEFDVERHPREETPTPPADEVPAVENSPCVPEAENVADSGDESEEEWKYFSVEPSKQAAQANFDQLLPQHQPEEPQKILQEVEAPLVTPLVAPLDLAQVEDIVPTAPPPEEPELERVEPGEPVEPQPEVTESLDHPIEETLEENQHFLQGAEGVLEKQECDEADMDYPLNPNAAEFVPVSPTLENRAMPPSPQPLDFGMDASAPPENPPSFEKEEIPKPDRADLDIGQEFQTDLQQEMASAQQINADFHTDFVQEVHQELKDYIQENSVDHQEVPTDLQLEMASAQQNYDDFKRDILDFQSESKDSHTDFLQDMHQELKDNIQESSVDFMSELAEKSPIGENPFASSIDRVAQDFVENILDACAPQTMPVTDPFQRDIFGHSETQVDDSRDRHFEEQEEIQQHHDDRFETDLLDTETRAPEPELSPVKTNMDDFLFSEPPKQQDLPESDMFLDRDQMMVETLETPNFSVAQGPTFPVVETLATPEEDSATSPAVEEVSHVPDPMILEQPPLSPSAQLGMSPIPTPPIAVCHFGFSAPPDFEPAPVEAPMSPQQAPLSPEMDQFISNIESVAAFDREPLFEAPPMVPEPAVQIPEITPREEFVEDATATPPPTPAMTMEQMSEDKSPELPQEIVEAVEKLTVSEPEDAAPESESFGAGEIAAVAAVGAVAAGAAAVAAATKGTKKPSSPIKEKVSSPTKDKPTGVPPKKAPTAAAPKAPPKAAPGKTSATAAKTNAVPSKTSAAPKPAPSATTKAPPKAAPIAKKTAPSTTSAPAASAAAKPRLSSSTTATKSPRPSVTSTVKTTPTATKPKPAPAAASKTTETRKSLTNGDATKSAAPAKRLSMTTTRPAAPKPASSVAAPKPAVGAAARITTTGVTKAPPKPRPASAAVNGVAKTMTATKPAAPRPSTATTSTLAAAKRTTMSAAAKPSAPGATSTKLVKETANKQLSSTTTRTVASRTTTASKTATTKTTPSSTGAKVPPGKKPITKPATKSPSNKTEVVTSKVQVTEEMTAQVHVNGNGLLENGGKEALVIDVVQQQDILIETSAPCLMPVDGNME